MLFEHVAGPVAAGGAPGVSCCGLRVISMHGSATDVPDSAENAPFFGRPSTAGRDGAFPQVRWVTAADSGTGALTEASSEVFCLVTSLFDLEEHPSLDLACCYPDRWGCETVIGHHKTDMGEGQSVLRSKELEGVAREMWALFAVYQAICTIAGIGSSAMGIPRTASASRTPWQPWPSRSRLSP
jgi:hypothetical protein